MQLIAIYDGIQVANIEYIEKYRYVNMICKFYYGWQLKLFITLKAIHQKISCSVGTCIEWKLSIKINSYI